ncbi:hypothetical protein OG258_19945 [Streptomyces mirabilis]|uniref:hypothetical protein n=1 Tax=Streptomyces mirabilis TaxID=68239 RepID=UPI002E28BC43|nr:hypothetical protein [Streptomyces mirabilis]
MPYATVQEFTDFLDPDPVPANAARLLDKASRKLDQLLIGTRYPTSNGLPTDPELAAVFKEAVCLQAQYIADLGDETGANANVSQLHVGNQRMIRALSLGGDGTSRVSPDMLTLLQTSGLLLIYPIVWG